MSRETLDAVAQSTTVALAKVAEKWSLPKAEVYMEFAKHYEEHMQHLEKKLED